MSAFFLLFIHYCSFFFFFNDTATTEIYTLSLHDALPILSGPLQLFGREHELSFGASWSRQRRHAPGYTNAYGPVGRSEEHTSELQSQSNLVCRLLLEKKKKNNKKNIVCRAHNDDKPNTMI